MSTNSPRRRKRHTPRHATARSSLLRRVLLLSSILVFAGQVTTVVVATVGAFTIPTPITRTVNQLITTRLSLFQYNSAFHRSSHDHSANKPTPRRGRVVSILSTKCSPRNHCRAATRWPQLSRVQRRASSWGEILHGVIINPLQVGGVSISMMSTLPRLTCYHGDDSSWTARSIRSRRAVTTSYKYALSSRAHLWALCGSRLFCSAPAEGTQESGSGGDGGGEERALLLRMDFEHADIEELRRWIRRYPFGTTLPVQPFSLVETEKGLDVIFRKKPTLERGSQDGGLSFVVESSVSHGQGDGRMRPTLLLRRISTGQEIRKMFAERIVVKAMVKSLAGDGTPPAPPGTKACAVLHEGLV